MLQAVSQVKQHSVAVPRGIHVHVRDIDHATQIACQFAEAASCIYEPSRDLSSGLMTNTSWSLRSFQTLWRTLSSGSANSQPHAPTTSSIVIVMDCIRRAVRRLAAFEHGASSAEMCSKILIRCLGAVTVLTAHLEDDNFQISLLEVLRLYLSVQCRSRVEADAAPLRSILVRLSQSLDASSSHSTLLARFIAGLLAVIAVSGLSTISTRVDFIHQEAEPIVLQFEQLADQLAVGAQLGYSERPAKRLKQQITPRDHALRSHDITVKELSQLLKGWPPSSAEYVLITFNRLTEPQQLRVLELLAALACARSGKESRNSFRCRNHGRLEEEQADASDEPKVLEHATFELLAQLVKSEDVSTSSRLKCAALIAVRHWAFHTHTIDNLRLESTEVGKWCLQGFRSSSREVRAVCGETLRAFLNIEARNAVDVSRQNHSTVLNLLRSLSQSTDARILETVLTTFGQVAETCTEEELNLVLIQLVEYLGSANTLISSLASLEIQRIADALEKTPEELFRPYWRTTAISVVQDLRKKPHKAQLLADALGWTLDHLLTETETHTLPQLVLRGQTEILQRIAKAQGTGASVFDICVKDQNLPTILATLISQHPSNGEAIVQQCLANVKADISDSEIAQIFKTDPAAIAREVLLITVQSQNDAGEKVRRFCFMESPQLTVQGNPSVQGAGADCGAARPWHAQRQRPRTSNVCVL